ncbi:MAG TPA: cytochrome c biogenesis protein CcdA [Bryobacteraceae bacterium]|nr:cytochrome c biogenesis protein CcdA [Bryobacteraceae bacterium]
MRHALLLLCLLPAFAQGQQHASWTLTAEPAAAPPGSTVRIRAAVRIDPGWHLYSASSAAGIPAQFTVSPETLEGVLQPPPKRAFDAVQQAETETYEGGTTFLLNVKVRADAPAGPDELTVNGRYQTCNDKSCVAGKLTAFKVPFTVDPTAPAPATAVPTGFAVAKPPAAGASPDVGTPAPEEQGWPAFLLLAFGAGLACIFTPCVFPMIPITMSYFLNQQPGEKRGGVSQAVVFCLGIIVLFSGMGLLVTAVLGPVGVKQLGSNPWVNGFIALLFMAFGLSLLGAFEITIPSSVLTRLNQSSGAGGFAGTLLMGLTFALSSFACVGPFVGTLLAASATEGRARPVIGMVVFAAGLALPFFLLALFPSYLKRLPRSGGWLARVKVVMGFVILAASLKYLSSVDQVLQWGFLTRERFLAAWIVLFGMAGLYLLGFVRLEGVKADENMGLGRLLTGMVCLIFAVSLWPGMSGGKLGLFDAYVPAAAEAAGGTASSGDGLVWIKDRYRDALDQARREHKLVFIDFTGYACANCHWMRANVLSRPEFAALLKNFVLLELYTDNGDATDDANAKLEQEKFGTIATPFYAIVDADDDLAAKWDNGATRTDGERAQYLSWLQAAAQKAPSPAAAAASPSVIALPQLTTLTGTPFDTGALTGKVVVVNFWATWCIPCVGELPVFNKLHRDLTSKGVAVVGIDMGDEGIARVRSFLTKHPIDYPVGLAGDAIAAQYKLESFPVTLVFDRSGKLIQRFDESLTEKDLLAAVQKAL